MSERADIDGGEDDLVHRAFREVVELSLCFFILGNDGSWKRVSVGESSESRIGPPYLRGREHVQLPLIFALPRERSLRVAITRRECGAGRVIREA